MEFCVSFFRNGLILCRTSHHLWARFQSVLTLICTPRRRLCHYRLLWKPLALFTLACTLGSACELGCVPINEWTVVLCQARGATAPPFVSEVLCRQPGFQGQGGRRTGERSAGQAGGAALVFQTETTSSSWLLHLCFPPTTREPVNGSMFQIVSHSYTAN